MDSIYRPSHNNGFDLFDDTVSHPFQGLTDYILLCSQDDNNNFNQDISKINIGVCPSNQFIQYCWLVLIVEKRNNITFNERVALINILFKVCSLKKYCSSCAPLDDPLHSQCDKNFNFKRVLRYPFQRYVNFNNNNINNSNNINNNINNININSRSNTHNSFNNNYITIK